MDGLQLSNEPNAKKRSQLTSGNGPNQPSSQTWAAYMTMDWWECSRCQWFINRLATRGQHIWQWMSMIYGFNPMFDNHRKLWSGKVVLIDTNRVLNTKIELILSRESFVENSLVFSFLFWIFGAIIVEMRDNFHQKFAVCWLSDKCQVTFLGCRHSQFTRFCA